MQDITPTMDEATINLTDIQLDGEDDVEAHGLREVAVGLTAAAVIGGGAATALAAQSTAAPRIAPPHAVTQAVGDATQLGGHVTDGVRSIGGQLGQDAGQAAGDAVGGTEQIAGDAVSLARTVAGPALTKTTDIAGSALGTVQRTVAGARTLAAHELDAASRTVSDTKAAARTLAGDAVSLANGTEKTALNMTHNTVGAATSKVKSAEATVLQVVSYARSVVGGWSIDVKVLGHEVSTSGTTLQPSGVVTLTDKSGTELASARLVDGKATLHLNGAGANASYNLTYGGDVHFAMSGISDIVPEI
jgi:hypothetical protein